MVYWYAARTPFPPSRVPLPLFREEDQALMPTWSRATSFAHPCSSVLPLTLVYTHVSCSRAIPRAIPRVNAKRKSGPYGRRRCSPRYHRGLSEDHIGIVMVPESTVGHVGGSGTLRLTRERIEIRTNVHKMKKKQNIPGNSPFSDMSISSDLIGSRRKSRNFCLIGI